MKTWLMLLVLIVLLPMVDGATGPTRRVKKERVIPNNYVLIYYNRQYTEYYCTQIWKDEYILSDASCGIQISVKADYLRRILIYPKSLDKIQTRP